MLYKVTVKKTQQFSNGGIRLEKGMFVEVASVISSPSAFLASTQEKNKIREAFLTKYGVDLQTVYALTGIWLDAQRIG